MAARPVFSLPPGLTLNTDDGKLNIRYDGDIHLSHTLGMPLGNVTAGGNLILELPIAEGVLTAGKTLRITGDIDAESLRGDHIQVSAKSVTCKSIAAGNTIQIGPAELTCDCIIAPSIDIDPNASGRVKVVESNNERGATKIKGGFSLADYEDMFGDSANFLAGLGLAPLSGDEAAAPPEPVDLTPVNPAPAPEEDDEDIDDPLSLSIEDLEPLEPEPAPEPEPEPEAPSLDPEVEAELAEAVERIAACYEGEPPPAIRELQAMVDEQDYASLSENITDVWNGLLGYHQQRGIRPHHQVTHLFKRIHAIVG